MRLPYYGQPRAALLRVRRAAPTCKCCGPFVRIRIEGGLAWYVRKYHLCERILVGVVAIILLWITNLQVCNSLVSSWMQAPTQLHARAALSNAYLVASQGKLAYGTCVDRTIRECDEIITRGLEQETFRSLAVLARNDENLERLQSNITTCDLELSMFLDYLANVTASYSSANMTLMSPTASPRCDYLAQTLVARPNVSSRAFAASLVYVDVTNQKLYTDQKSQLAARVEYDRAYVSNKTSQMIDFAGPFPSFNPDRVFSELATSLTAFSQRVDASMNDLFRNLDQYAVQGAHLMNQAVGILMNGARDALDFIGWILNKLDWELFRSGIDTAAFFLGMGTSFLSSHGWFNGIFQTYNLTLPDLPINLTIPDGEILRNLTRDLAEHIGFCAANLTNALHRTVNETTRVALIRQEQVTKFTANYTSPAVGLLTNVSADISAVFRNYSQTMNSTSVRNSLVGVPQAAAGLAQQVLDNSSQLNEQTAADGAAYLSLGSELVSERRQFNVFVDVPEIDLSLALLSSLTSLAFVMDFVFRAFYTLYHIVRFWNITAIDLPRVDVRVDYLRGRGVAISRAFLPQQCIRLLTHPIVIVTLALAGFIVAFSFVTSIYLPIYDQYLEGCMRNDVRDPKLMPGTFLYNNTYATMVSWASTQGDLKIGLGLDRLRASAQLTCQRRYFVQSLRYKIQAQNFSVMFSAMRNLVDSHQRYVDCLHPAISMPLTNPQALAQSTCILPLSPAATLRFRSSGDVDPGFVLSGEIFDGKRAATCTPEACGRLDDGLARANSWISACTAEGYVHGAFMGTLLTILMFVSINLSRMLCIRGVVRIMWRKLTRSDRFEFFASSERDGTLLYPKLDPVKSPTFSVLLHERIHDALFYWSMKAYGLVVSGILVNIPWLFMLSFAINTQLNMPVTDPAARFQQQNQQQNFPSG